VLSYVAIITGNLRKKISKKQQIEELD
jgi:hypothetical protein